MFTSEVEFLLADRETAQDAESTFERLDLIGRFLGGLDHHHLPTGVLWLDGVKVELGWAPA